MRKADIEKMTAPERAYTLLLLKMATYREQIEKVTLHRKKNNRGRLVSSIMCDLVDCERNTYVERFRLMDDDYLWFMCALQEDFPNVAFEDYTAEKDKVTANE